MRNIPANSTVTALLPQTPRVMPSHKRYSGNRFSLGFQYQRETQKQLIGCNHTAHYVLCVFINTNVLRVFKEFKCERVNSDHRVRFSTRKCSLTSVFMTLNKPWNRPEFGYNMSLLQLPSISNVLNSAVSSLTSK